MRELVKQLSKTIDNLEFKIERQNRYIERLEKELTLFRKVVKENNSV